MLLFITMQNIFIYQPSIKVHTLCYTRSQSHWCKSCVRLLLYIPCIVIMNCDNIINYKMSSCLLFFDIYFLDCMLMSLLQSVRILSWICHLLIFLFQALSHKPLHQMEPNLSKLLLRWSWTFCIIFIPFLEIQHGC